MSEKNRSFARAVKKHQHPIAILAGERKEEKNEENEEYYHREMAYGSFQRTIPLNAKIDAGKAEAVFKNGVYYDYVLFGILKNEWLALRNAA